MPRKTVEVAYLQERINDQLDRMKNADLMEAWVNSQIEEGYTPAQAARMVLATLLEGVLFRTDNYHGFIHKDSNLGTVDETLREYL
jgi:hypothetical protein